MTDQRLTSWLEEAGYEIFRRHEGWHECLIAQGEERWLGRGPDAQGALRDALRRMLPSRAARELLATWLDVPIDELQLGGVVVAEDMTPPPVSSRRWPEHGQAVRPPSIHDQEASSRRGFESALVEPARHAPPALEPELDRDATREGLEILRDVVYESEGELGISCPERQRLVILGWIARARWLQDMYPGDQEIESLARDVAGSLGAFCKRWWPGNVRALQRNSHPEDVTRDLSTAGVHAASPVTWKKIADLAEEAQERLEDRDEARGCDAYGWADRDSLAPFHRAPDAALEALADEVSAVTGALGLARPLQVAPDPDRFLSWVRRLRWLRSVAADSNTWGDIAGRLRYLASTYGSLLADGAEDLDSGFRPAASWSSLLGYDRKHKERSRQIREVFDSVPKVSSRTQKDALLEWLMRALPYADTQGANITSAMEPFSEKVLELLPSDLPEADRRIRRRLHKLQQALRGEPVTTELEAVDFEEPAAELTVAQSSLPQDALEHALELTRRKRAAFVSNRNDPDLMQALEESFKFASIKWCEGEPRRVQALAESISAGKYDIVFAATGFQSHAVDGILARACRDADLLYVRVNRGRPLACLRALTRITLASV